MNLQTIPNGLSFQLLAQICLTKHLAGWRLSLKTFQDQLLTPHPFIVRLLGHHLSTQVVVAQRPLLWVALPFWFLVFSSISNRSSNWSRLRSIKSLSGSLSVLFDLALTYLNRLVHSPKLAQGWKHLFGNQLVLWFHQYSKRMLCSRCPTALLTAITH